MTIQALVDILPIKKFLLSLKKENLKYRITLNIHDSLYAEKQFYLRSVWINKSDKKILSMYCFPANSMKERQFNVGFHRFRVDKDSYSKIMKMVFEYDWTDL